MQGGHSGENGVRRCHAAVMDFRILGPVEAIGPDGHALPCPGRPLRLLALLLVDGTRVVPADIAIEALWGDALPAHPANALQLVVSRLRRVLGEDAIVWRADGYELRLDSPDAVDAHRFQRLTADGREALARGDSAAARELLADALALWRGPALQDVRYEQFAIGEAERLDELRLVCLGARIDADLALGRHADVVAELQALVAEHPLREPLRAQLMLALYRCGRQADALATYADARSWLADELGLDPSPELRTLERDILEHRVDPPATARPGRREVVCVAAEVRATERGSPLDPEVLLDVMERCHAAMEAVAHRHGGPTRELRGYGMIAAFGAPIAHEDDALRAARAALALQGATGRHRHRARARARHRPRGARRRHRRHGADRGLVTARPAAARRRRRSCGTARARCGRGRDRHRRSDPDVARRRGAHGSRDVRQLRAARAGSAADTASTPARRPRARDGASETRRSSTLCGNGRRGS